MIELTHRGKSSVLATAPQASLTDTWSGLDLIAEAPFNAAYLARDASVSAALAEWMRESREARTWEGAPAKCPTSALLADLPEVARTQIEDDLARLLPRFAQWTRRDHVRVHLSQVRDDACRKFHVDFIGLRALITYVGQGTEWVESEHARREQVGRHDLSLDEANLAIVPDMTKVRFAREGDVLVLKGEAFEGNRGGGAIHRSPPCIPSQPRLVLRVDVPQCGC